MGRDMIFRRLCLFGIFFGAALFALSLIFSGLSWWVGSTGLIVLLLSYILFLGGMYVAKLRVFSRSGWVYFRLNPWRYRFYFLILILPWIISVLMVLDYFARYIRMVRD
jgi:hypothetical protein